MANRNHLERMFWFGLASERPTFTSSTRGAYYLATDTGRFSIWDGVTWWDIAGSSSSGPGYSTEWSGTTVAAVASTVIPNGAGDVTAAVTILYNVKAVTGTDGTGGMAVLTPSTSWVIYDDGTDELTLYCNADGSVTVQRTAGADTWQVILKLLWH